MNTQSFKEEDFIKILDMAMVNRKASDSQLVEMIKKQLDCNDKIADKYLESLHDYFSRGIF